MKKRDRTIIIMLLSAILLLVGGNIARKVIRERNVFDEMYYSRVHKTYDWFGVFGGNPRTMFYNMPQMAGVTRDNEMISTEEGHFYEHYKQDYLGVNETLHISMYTDKKEMFINFSYDDSERHKWYSYHYYVNDKLLVYETNDPDNTERKNFLYEIFLPDWFEANEGVSHYSMDNLGEFTFKDESVETE